MLSMGPSWQRSMLFTNVLVATKYLTKQLEHSSRVQSILEEKLWRQEPDVPGPMTSAVMGQRVRKA